MVRIIIVLIVILTFSYADSFQKNCLECHDKSPITFDKFYMQYLIKFSSEKRIKEAMFYYLKDPKIEQSVMDVNIVNGMGIMPHLNLDDDTLMKLINEYIRRFDVKRSLH